MFCQVKRSMPSSAPPSSLSNLHFYLASVTKDQMQLLVQKQHSADAAAGNCAGGSNKGSAINTGHGHKQGWAQIAPVLALQEMHAHTKCSDHAPPHPPATLSAVTDWDCWDCCSVPLCQLLILDLIRQGL